MNSGASKKQYDHLIKLIIIGDSSVGKSCILLRFSEDHFPTSHMPTIGKSRDSSHLSQLEKRTDIFEEIRAPHWMREFT